MDRNDPNYKNDPAYRNDVDPTAPGYTPVDDVTVPGDGSGTAPENQEQATRPSGPAPASSAARLSAWPSVALRAQSSVAPSVPSPARSPVRRPKVTTRPDPAPARLVAVPPAPSSVARSPDLRVPSSVPLSVPRGGAGAGDQTEEEVEESDHDHDLQPLVCLGRLDAGTSRHTTTVGQLRLAHGLTVSGGCTMTRPLRIAQVAPPMERVPPRAYGGTERIVYELVKELDRRGHEVTTFASGDSDVPGHARRRPSTEALRPSGYSGDASPWFYLTIQQVLDQAGEFDIIHSHLEWASFLLARVSPIPVVSTFHGRLDLAWAAATFARPTPGLVAISANQAATHPEVEWAGVVHNGLTLDDSPFERRRGDALCFVGRVAPEKGIVEAIEIAKATGRPLRIAAKAGPTAGRARVLRQRLHARGRGGRLVDRVPRRARAGRPRPAVRGVVRVADAGFVAGAVRAGRHRGARLRDAGHRPARRGAARDHPRRHRRLLRRRCRAARLPGRPRRDAGPGGDPGVGAGPVLCRAG